MLLVLCMDELTVSPSDGAFLFSYPFIQRRSPFASAYESLQTHHHVVTPAPLHDDGVDGLHDGGRESRIRVRWPFVLNVHIRAACVLTCAWKRGT